MFGVFTTGTVFSANQIILLGQWGMIIQLNKLSSIMSIFSSYVSVLNFFEEGSENKIE